MPGAASLQPGIQSLPSASLAPWVVLTPTEVLPAGDVPGPTTV